MHSSLLRVLVTSHTANASVHETQSSNAVYSTKFASECDVTLELYRMYTMYMYTVPALHKDPDIQVMDNNNETQFTLIEHDTVYNCEWDTDDWVKMTLLELKLIKSSFP